MGVCLSSDVPVSDKTQTKSKTFSTPIQLPLEPLSEATLFAATFNINGSPLAVPDVDAMLNSHGASSCDLILLAFQECGSCCWGSAASPSVRLGDDDMNSHNDKAFLDVIMSNLSRPYEIVGDNSIGEPPTSEKVDIEGVKTEWYGFVRMIVLKAADSRLDLGVIRPFECCCGSKLSMFSPHHYPESEAPDKGAVGFIFEGPKLIVLSAHLMGTNKYAVPEETFDKERRKQVRLDEGGGL